jgi:hypothetical protein
VSSQCNRTLVTFFVFRDPEARDPLGKLMKDAPRGSRRNALLKWCQSRFVNYKVLPSLGAGKRSAASRFRALTSQTSAAVGTTAWHSAHSCTRICQTLFRSTLSTPRTSGATSLWLLRRQPRRACRSRSASTRWSHWSDPTGRPLWDTSRPSTSSSTPTEPLGFYRNLPNERFIPWRLIPDSPSIWSESCTISFDSIDHLIPLIIKCRILSALMKSITFFSCNGLFYLGMCWCWFLLLSNTVLFVNFRLKSITF